MTPPVENSALGHAGTRLFTPLGMVLTVAVITAMRLGYLTVYPFGLQPDEAQYWSWSLDPAWGYFSKPPMVAWLIAGTTALCGSTEACIKASVPLLHGLTACFIYGAASRLYGRRAGYLAGLLYLTLPGVSFSSAIISTDPPLLTFWSAGLYALVRLGEARGRAYSWWLALGLAMGLVGTAPRWCHEAGPGKDTEGSSEPHSNKRLLLTRVTRDADGPLAFSSRPL